MDIIFSFFSEFIKNCVTPNTFNVPMPNVTTIIGSADLSVLVNYIISLMADKIILKYAATLSFITTGFYYYKRRDHYFKGKILFLAFFVIYIKQFAFLSSVGFDKGITILVIAVNLTAHILYNMIKSKFYDLMYGGV